MSIAKEYYKLVIKDFNELKNNPDFKFDKKNEDLKKYIEEAMENGCCFGKSGSGTADIFIERKDKNGDLVMFHQGLYNDPRSNTFVEFYLDDGRLNEANRCSECYGINIWEFEKLVDAAYVCGKCKKKARRLNDMKWVMYAALECEECAEESWKSINSKPSGYYTC